ncbi:MAG: 1-acyl-sn-glycerol-3-phosphate acyltransferase [Firmicutes bacterium]|nr:1-acyl-sn-glycerol-3-phosphate acyltransferase [Bacillota bacterium]
MISLLFLIFIAAFMYLMTLVVENLWFLPLWFFLGIIVSFFAIVIFIVIQFPIFKRTKFTNRYKYYICRSTSHWLIIFFLRLRIQITGKENIPNDGLLTIFANHKSYADPFIVFEIMKRPTTFTPKMSVYKLPLVGTLLKYLGAFPIDRSSDRNTARAMVDAIKVIKDGMAMAIFPEGGIKDRNDEKMVAMRAGAYRVAMKAGADLLPISIQNTTSIKYRAPFRSTKIIIVIHPVVRYEDVKHLTTLEVADKMFNIINQKLIK